MLCCIHPQHVPNKLDSDGAEFLREQRGGDDSSAAVELEAGWWISPAEIRYQWDGREQLWDSGQELLRVGYDERELDLWRLADLILDCHEQVVTTQHEKG